MSRLLVILALTFLTVFMPLNNALAADNSDLEMTNKLMEISEIIKEYHLLNPDSKVIWDGAIYGMIDTLEDPYAEYFTAEEIQAFTDSLNGDLVGVGIEVRFGKDYCYVADIIPNTPAQKGGVQAGDIILAVNGKDLFGQKLGEVVNQIRGPQGTKVTLMLRRGNEEFELTLERAEIHVPTVKWEMMSGNTGYIKVSTFGSATAKEFEEAIDGLMSSGVHSMIIDLRDNGGGYLNAAVDMLGLFLKPDSVVVSVVDKHGTKEDVVTEQEPLLSPMPMVVLVNDMSASASEIMAAALRDYGLATVMGDRTFGKGMVQNVFPLQTGGAVKLTIYRYLTPSGQDIDMVGIEPDHLVLTDGLAKEVAWQMLNMEKMPSLTILSNISGENVLVNDQKAKLRLNIINKNNTAYVPLRPVMEAMLYEVAWQDGTIKIFSGDITSKVFDLRNTSLKAANGSEIWLENGLSYIPVHMLGEFGITVKTDQNGYQFNRLIH